MAFMVDCLTFIAAPSRLGIVTPYFYCCSSVSVAAFDRDDFCFVTAMLRMPSLGLKTDLLAPATAPSTTEKLARWLA